MGRIVWIASFPKSGNTWVRVFLNNLLAGAEAPVALDSIGRFTASEAAVEHYRSLDPRPPAAWTPADTARMRPRVHAHIAGLKDGLSLVKTHCRLGHDHGQPTVNLDVTAGAVYIVRDPLDVAVSFADHMGMTIDQAISIMAFPGAFTDPGETTVSEPRGSWSENVASWTSPERPSVHVVRFEDLLADPKARFGAIARHLRIGADDAAVDRAINFSTFDVLKEQERSHGFRERSRRARRPFFREGRAGAWREALSEVQVGAIVEAHRVEMGRFGYVPAGF